MHFDILLKVLCIYRDLLSCRFSKVESKKLNLKQQSSLHEKSLKCEQLTDSDTKFLFVFKTEIHKKRFNIDSETYIALEHPAFSCK